MEWSDVNVLKLIEIYRNKSILWDPLQRDHYKKPLKSDAWREISAEISVEINISADPDQCKKKMISLLSSYRREKSKYKNSLGTGKGRDEIYASRWFAYDAFKFLEDRDVPRKGLTTEVNQILENEDEVNAEESQETRQSTSGDRPTKKIKKSDGNDSMMKSAFDLLRSTAEKLDKEQGKPNEVDAFFTYVASKVNKYSSATQKSVQHEIFEILVKADRGVFDGAAPYVQHPNNWQTTPERLVYLANSQEYIPTPIQSPSDSKTSISSQPSSASAIPEQFSDFV